MKSIIALLACALSAAAISATSTPKGFTDDLDAALAEAKTSGKYVYACFSGSDWCIWCKRLEKEVFSDASYDFVGALKNDYLFVFIDSPRDKSLLSEQAKERNPKLVKQYKVRGYPSALILDGEGKRIDETGYRAGGAKAYAQYLKLLKKFGADGLKAKTKEADRKYFSTFEKKVNEHLKKLSDKPTLADFEAAQVAFNGYLKELDTMKFEADDAELAEMSKASWAGRLNRFLKMIDRDIKKLKEDGKSSAK